MSNDNHRQERSVTITQTPEGIRVNNDWGTEEVSDVLIPFALGLQGIALAVEKQTGIEHRRVVDLVCHTACQETSPMAFKLRHKNDETGEVENE